MADQPISSMFVLLGLNTVDFEKGSKAASDAAKRTADDIDKSFGSVTEARHGLMLTEEAFGVRLPRSLNTLLAKLPGVQTAFSAMLPIAGVVVAIEVIGKLIEKHDALALAIAKMKRDTDDLTIKEHDRTEGLQLENLKLEDQINKIEGRPSKNHLSEALLESKIRADELAESLDSIQSKSEGVFEAELTVMGRLKREFSSLKDVAQAVLADLDSATHGNSSAPIFQTDVSKVNAELRSVEESYDRVQQARMRLTDAKGTKDEEEAIKALAAAYKDYGEKATSAFVVTRTLEKDNISLLSALRQAQVSANSGMADEGEMVKNLHDRVRLAADQISQEAKERREKDAKADAEATKIGADSRIAAEDALVKHLHNIHQLSAEDELKQLRALEDEKLTLIEKGIQEQIDALSGSKNPDDLNKVKVLNAQLEAAKQAHNARMLELDDQFYAREEEKQRKSIEEQEKTLEKFAQLQLQHAKEVADFKEKIGLINTEQMLKEQKAADDTYYKQVEDALNKEIALLKELDPEDPDKYQAQEDKLQEIRREHRAKMQEDDRKFLEEEKKQWDVFFGSIEKGFAQNVADSMFSNKSILADLKKTAEDAVKQWVAMLIEMKLKALDAKLFDAIFHTGGATAPLEQVSTKITVAATALDTSSVKLGASASTLSTSGTTIGTSASTLSTAGTTLTTASTTLNEASAAWDATAAQIMAAAQELMAANQSGGGGSDTGAGLLSFLPGFADGGDVRAGVPIMVGEHGPEPFIPAMDGTIIPNDMLGGGKTTVISPVLHFHGVKDMDSFRASKGQIMASLQNAVSSAAMRNR